MEKNPNIKNPSSLLERAHPEGYSQEWELSLKGTPTEDIPTGTSVVIFKIDSEWLALLTTYVKEIAEIKFIHRVPHLKSKVLLGLTNVQGKLCISLSLKTLLGFCTLENEFKRLKKNSYKRGIVFAKEKNDFLFPVDEVYGIKNIAEHELEPVPLNVCKSLANYTQSIFSFKKNFVGLLNDQLIFASITENYL